MPEGENLQDPSNIDASAFGGDTTHTNSGAAPSGEKHQRATTLKARLKKRVENVIDHLSRFAFIIVVTVAGLYTDKFLFWVITFVLKDELSQFIFVKKWFNYARIGIALMILLTAVVHAIFSTIDQIKIDRNNSSDTEDEE